MNSFIHTVSRVTKSGAFFAGLAIAAPILILVTTGFPFTGLAIFFGLLSTSVYFSKSFSSPLLKVLYMINLLFCACLVYRTQDFLVMLNLLAVIVSGSLMSLLPDGDKNYAHEGFFDLVFSPVRAFVGTISTKYSYHFSLPTKNTFFKEVKVESWFHTLVSVGISLILLMVILPLLASANPVFEHWLMQAYEWLDIVKLLELINIENLALWIYRVAAALILGYLIPRLAMFAVKGQTTPTMQFQHAFPLSLPKAVVAIVLGIFFLSQARLYFASSDLLLALGYSHSEFAREVFAQLTVVALIVVGLIYNDKNSKSFSRILTYILFLEGIFLTCIAMKSVLDYSWYWGLTYKRLWGIAGTLWMFAALGSFIYVYYQKLSSTFFVKAIALLSFATLLIVNVVNFDYLIFNYGKSTTHEGVDYSYLSGLSPDALSYREQFKTFEVMEQNPGDADTMPMSRTGYAARQISEKINYLQKKYSSLDFRTFNASEFLQYLEIKDIDTQLYDKKWELDTTSRYPYPQTKNSNRFDRFPMRSDIPTLYSSVNYYYVTSPSEQAVSQTSEKITEKHMLANDIWGQAGITFTALTEELHLPEEAVSQMAAGQVYDLPGLTKPKTPGLLIFVVDSYRGEKSVASIQGVPGKNSFIVITEDRLDVGEGRPLAQMIGYALGLSSPKAEVDQSLVSGLMGNLGYFDLSQPDVETARKNITKYQYPDQYQE